jgi:hypothetical protein
MVWVATQSKDVGRYLLGAACYWPVRQPKASRKVDRVGLTKVLAGANARAQPPVEHALDLYFVRLCSANLGCFTA